MAMNLPNFIYSDLEHEKKQKNRESEKNEKISKRKMKEDRIDQRGDFYEKSGWRETERERRISTRGGSIDLFAQTPGLLRSLHRTRTMSPLPVPLHSATGPSQSQRMPVDAESAPLASTISLVIVPRLSIMDARVLFRAFSSTRFASEEVVD